MFVVLLAISCFILSIICFCSGSPGGILAPVVIIGSLCGLISSEVHALLIGSATPVHLEVHVIAAIGGLFAATIQSPITGILLIIEMTHTYDQIVPILLAATMASLVSQCCNTNAIFDEILAQDLVEKEQP